MTASLRTRAAWVSVAAAAVALAPGAGCVGGGDVSLFGYSTKPNFDPNIKSVYIPTFKNIAFHTNPYRGIEVDATEAVVRELNARHTPIRVVQDAALADTELVGTITIIDKLVYLRNLQNLNREFDVIVQGTFVWRDLRTGRVYSGRQPQPPVAAEETIDPSVPRPAPPPPDPNPAGVVIRAVGKVIPELGESNATGEQKALKQLAQQIVNMLETPW